MAQAPSTNGAIKRKRLMRKLRLPLAYGRLNTCVWDSIGMSVVHFADILELCSGIRGEHVAKPSETLTAELIYRAFLRIEAEV